MTTKQWIGIEEAAKKYQVSSRRINTWCKKQEITCSEIDHYLMLDEDSLLRCIERHTQLSLTEKELEKRKERLIKESEEEIFLLQSMKELAPVMRQIIKELAGMIQNDNRRRCFFLSHWKEVSKNIASSLAKTPTICKTNFKDLYVKSKIEPDSSKPIKTK